MSLAKGWVLATAVLSSRGIGGSAGAGGCWGAPPKRVFLCGPQLMIVEPGWQVGFAVVVVCGGSDGRLSIASISSAA